MTAPEVDFLREFGAQGALLAMAWWGLRRLLSELSSLVKKVNDHERRIRVLEGSKVEVK